MVIKLMLRCTSFLGAFLLFSIQPMLGKILLPQYGGTAEVWSSCMLFFQIVLLAGYFFTHCFTKLESPSWKLCIIISCGLAAAFWPLQSILSEPARTTVAIPQFQIFFLLGKAVALAAVLLSSTSVLLQALLARTNDSRTTYSMYSWSNAGSLLGLFAYPFLIEAFLPIEFQLLYWQWALFVFLCLYFFCCAGLIWKSSALQRQAPKLQRKEAVGFRIAALWIILPACAVALMLAGTNQVCREVSPLPLLWVIPLALYLITFIMVFASDRWYSRQLFGYAILLGLVLITPAVMNFFSAQIFILAAIYFSVLFVGCMICHGELALTRPTSPKLLTSFYLSIAIGGAIGGIFVTLIAPFLFNSYLEFHISAWSSLILLYYCLLLSRKEVQPNASSPRSSKRHEELILPALCLLAIVSISSQAYKANRNVLATSRNFYGILRVRDTKLDSNLLTVREEVHGNVIHGAQFHADHLKTVPTTYYGYESGIGQVFLNELRKSNLKIAAIGLGIGTISNYARAGDTIKFFEINPAVIEFAKDYFWNLTQSAGTIEIIQGDGRLNLGKEQENSFDIIVVDAFSGDAIPTHLLTKEAFDLYLSRLSTKGILALHLSNQYLDLVPAVVATTRELKLNLAYIVGEADYTKHIERSEWLILAKNEADITNLLAKTSTIPQPSKIWSDSYTNLLSAIRWQKIQK